MLKNVTQWYSTCLECIRTWVQFQEMQNNKNPSYKMNPHLQNVDAFNPLIQD